MHANKQTITQRHFIRIKQFHKCHCWSPLSSARVSWGWRVLLKDTTQWSSGVSNLRGPPISLLLSATLLDPFSEPVFTMHSATESPSENQWSYELHLKSFKTLTTFVFTGHLKEKSHFHLIYQNSFFHNDTYVKHIPFG